ncbi:hypothetical protein L1887_62301 [Cichorium endivia]|nr:hypothetical protein L1887_62301 [Cichorium endivia]
METMSSMPMDLSSSTMAWGVWPVDRIDISNLPDEASGKSRRQSHRGEDRATCAVEQLRAAAPGSRSEAYIARSRDPIRHHGSLADDVRIRPLDLGWGVSPATIQ